MDPERYPSPDIMSAETWRRRRIRVRASSPVMEGVHKILPRVGRILSFNLPEPMTANINRF
jgi:hypothetical protein